MPNRTKCSVKDCKQYVKFKFPKGEKNVENLKKWLQAIGDVNKEIGPNDGLCGSHFKPEDYTHQECEGKYYIE